MTEQVPSGATFAQAADNPAPATPSGTAGSQDAGSTQPFGTFGSARGSGLARGKRATHTAASAAPASAGGYQPTSIEVVVPQREYKNPFGGPETVGEPAPAPKVEAPAAPVEVARVVEAPKAETPRVEAPAPAASHVSTDELFPLDGEKRSPAEAPARAELNILPPAETKRTALHWEKSVEKDPAEGRPSRDFRRDDRRDGRRDDHREERRDERPTFRTDSPRPGREADAVRPREGEPVRSREGEPVRSREFDGPRSREAGSDNRPRDFQRSRSHESSRKPRGFFAWLKSLFMGKPEVAPESSSRSEGGEFRREDRPHHRRRHRGGRGRSQGGERGGPSQFQGSQQSGPGASQGQSQGGEHRGEHSDGHRDGPDGQRRRRHRGGRGRSRSEGGDRGGPRSEGQQGGGYI